MRARQHRGRRAGWLAGWQVRARALADVLPWPQAVENMESMSLMPGTEKPLSSTQ
jgi:hypothetical protein